MQVLAVVQMIWDREVWLRRRRLASAMLAAALVPSSLQGAAPQRPRSALDRTVTLVTARTMSTAELARRLVPHLAGRVVGHELVTQVMAPGEPFGSVRFFSRPTPLGPDLCQRTVFTARLLRTQRADDALWTTNDRVGTEGVDTTAELSAAPGCQTLEHGGFAAVTYPSTPADAAPALRQLLALQREARGSGGLSFDYICVAQDDPKMLGCPNARAFFAGMRLDQLSEISPGSVTYFTLPQGAADYHRWKISMTPQPGGRWGLSLWGMVIAPF